MVSAWIRHMFDSDSDFSCQASVEQDNNAAFSDSEQEMLCSQSPSNEADEVLTNGYVSTILNSH